MSYKISVNVAKLLTGLISQKTKPLKETRRGLIRTTMTKYDPLNYIHVWSFVMWGRHVTEEFRKYFHQQ